MGFRGNNKPKWKREIVSDQKFEDLNLNAFHDPSCTSRFGYIFVFIATIKFACVCLADLYTAVTLLVIGQTSVTPAIPTEYSKWIFLGCILVSYLLLVWDLIKARRILQTDDISYSFTSVIANRYLSIIESYAFFVFFTLKGWKRLLLAEAPRQIINIVTLEALAPHWLSIHNGSFSFNNAALGKDTMQQILTGTMIFSVIVFAISFLLVCVAAILYIPLLCHIRGNLKEYCCHKVDKRISEIIRKQGKRYRSNKVNHEAEHLINETYYNQSLEFPGSNSSNEQLRDLSSSIFDGRSNQHLLARNDQSCYRGNHKILGNVIKNNLGSPKDQHFLLKPSAQEPSNGNRAYQYYSSSKHIIDSPARNSSICANEQCYQCQKYSRGY